MLIKCWSYLFAYLTFIFKTFLQDALRKKRESGEFIEIGTNDILSQALGTLEYSGYIQARSYDVGILEFFFKATRGSKITLGEETSIQSRNAMHI